MEKEQFKTDICKLYFTKLVIKEINNKYSIMKQFKWNDGNMYIWNMIIEYLSICDIYSLLTVCKYINNMKLSYIINRKILIYKTLYMRNIYIDIKVYTNIKKWKWICKKGTKYSGYKFNGAVISKKLNIKNIENLRKYLFSLKYKYGFYRTEQNNIIFGENIMCINPNWLYRINPNENNWYGRFNNIRKNIILNKNDINIFISSIIIDMKCNIKNLLLVVKTIKRWKTILPMYKIIIINKTNWNKLCCIKKTKKIYMITEKNYKSKIYNLNNMFELRLDVCYRKSAKYTDFYDNNYIITLDTRKIIQ